jgi:hypothetical protein
MMVRSCELPSFIRISQILALMSSTQASSCCRPQPAGVGRAMARRVLEVAAEDGYAAMRFNAVVGTNEHVVRLWESLGFTIVVTVPEAFRHPDRGFVSLHIMHRFLR